MELENAIEYYNNNIIEYDNKIYKDIEVRFVHLCNFLNSDSIFSSWFKKRLSFYLEYSTNFDCVVDLGFSIPYPYFVIPGEELKKSKTKFVFIDKEKSAEDFYNMIVALPQLNYRKKKDILIKTDLDKIESSKKITEIIKDINPNKNLIVASEIIEHVNKPKILWKLIKNISELPNSETQIYVTLPVGVKIPSHNSYFLTFKDAKEYIEDNMIVDKYWDLIPPEDLPEIPYAKGVICALGRIR